MVSLCSKCRKPVTVQGEENFGSAVHQDGQEEGDDGHLAAPVDARLAWWL